MKPGAAVVLAFLSVIRSPASAQLPDDLKRKFDEAERRILRLPPAAFSELPSNIVRDLQRRGCAIPQTAFMKQRHNVVKGEFAKPGQTDWAVLCSVRGRSSILVFWNGSESNPAAIASIDDRNCLQGITAAEIGFSRGVSAVGRDFIMRHYKAYGGLVPPPIDHHGIDDAFIEKASATWFFHSGMWLKLTGSD